MSGEGVGCDLDLAVRLHRLSAELGNEIGQLNLGLIRLKASDLSGAVSIWKRAAEGEYT